MYFKRANHNPPHVHVLYNGEYMGAIDIRTLEMLEGDLPNRALSMAQEWIAQYQTELLEIWNTQKFVKLPPLD